MKKVILNKMCAQCITFKAMLILISALYIPAIHAQVNIGANEDAVAGAILQLKEIPGVTDSTQNANRGLALPRVQLSDVNQLYPMFLVNPADSTSGPNSVYASDKATLDQTHTGLIVYNVTDDASKGLSPGLAQWDGSKWKPLVQVGPGNAAFAVLNCVDITVNGGYVVNTPTNSQNFLKIDLDVKTPGAYTIIAQSGNGYSFYLSGMALNPGLLTVAVPAQGTPISSQDDVLDITGIPVAAGCQQTISVSESIADYSLNCAAIVVEGVYQKGIALDGSNTIEITVSVTGEGSYFISTPETNGISFSASGEWDMFDTGSQTITLTGSGTPTVNSDFPITVYANTPTGTTSCSVTISITAPPLTYAIIGDTQDWSWNDVARTAALTSGTNFGPNGTVRVSSFTQLWATSSTSTATNNLYYGVNGKIPDIVLYFSYPVYPDNGLATALAQYVIAGGCLIFGAAADGGSTYIANITTLLTTMFGSSGVTAQAQVSGSQGSDNDYQIANLPNDPIINGPFGNLAGPAGYYYWGEDNTSTSSVVVPVLPSRSVQICSAYNADGKAGVSPVSSIVWYSTYLNFVFFGDSGGASATSTSSGSYPSYYPGGIPTSKSYGPTGYTHYIFNSQLELNAVAWAIKQAVSNGVNPH